MFAEKFMKKIFVFRVINRLYAYTDEYFLLPFLGIFGRWIFGNNAGFFNNVFARSRLRHLQQCCQLNGIKTEQAKQLIREGVLKLAYPYSPDLIKKIKLKYQQIINDPTYCVNAGHPPHQDAHINIKNPLQTIPEIKELLNDQVINMIQQYYGTYFKVGYVRCWRNNHVPAVDTQSNVYSNQWHNDQFDTNMLKLFIYLSDSVTKHTGAFCGFNKSYTKKIMRSWGYFRRSHIFGKARSLIQKGADHAFFEGELGYTFFANPTVCLHRATIPSENNCRDIVQFTIYPSATPLPEDWEKTIQPDSFKD